MTGHFGVRVEYLAAERMNVLARMMEERLESEAVIRRLK